jgi:hypothetical protein
MAFGTWFVNKTNAPIYIMCTFGMQGQKIWDKNLVASATSVITTYMQILHATYAILT